MRNALLAVSPLFLGISFASVAQVDDETAIGIAQPHETIVGRETDRKLFTESSRAAEGSYGVWTNGSQAFGAAISKDFVEYTLPAQLPQGPTGSAIASKAFLSTIPDLGAEVEQGVAGRVVSQIRFASQLTTRSDRKGSGETVDFTAIDILRTRWQYNRQLASGGQSAFWQHPAAIPKN